MNETEFLVFEKLFREAVKKCFAHELAEPLSETESKLFYNRVFENTGLVIGWKSLKNYSIYVLDKSKPENPSVPTLDTLARYIQDAPYTDEIKRKETESHYPYWFGYKNKILSAQRNEVTNASPKRNKRAIIWVVVPILLLVTFAFIVFSKQSKETEFTADFANTINENENGWMIKYKDSNNWNKRNQNPGYLTLFTMKGDNWPDTTLQPVIIKNLLYREISSNCFVAEVHMQDFIPRSKWQQAGLLLLEDSTLSSRSVRLSLGYNDYFGGYKRSPEIIIQGISSSGKSDGKPEEFIHNVLFQLDSVADSPVLLSNLYNTSLRIEKKDNQFRFLYAGGKMTNGAFHEVGLKTLDIQPKYIGLFALKGFVDDTLIQPVRFRSFALSSDECH